MADPVTQTIEETIADIPVSAKLQPDTLIQIMATALLVALTTELINWFLIFRHENYKSGVQKVLKEQENYDSQRDKLVFRAGEMTSNQYKIQKRRLDSAEQQLKVAQQAVMWQKTRGTLFVGALTMVCVGMINQSFSGMVAARLPFVPFQMIRNMTHYGIQNTDFQDVSTTFMFMLTNLSLGQYLKRMLALEGPRITMPTPDILKQQ